MHLKVVVGMAAIRRLHRTHFRCFISLVSCINRPPLQSLTSHSTPTFYTNNFSQTFRRTVCAHSLTLSNYPQSNYNPIDFHEFDPKFRQNDDVGTLELVELVQKTKDFASKQEAIDFIVSSGVNPDVNQVYFAIWDLRSDWQLSLLVFELNGKWGFVNDKILSLIVWVLGTHHKFDIAWSLIRDFHGAVDIRPAMLAIVERYAAGNCHEKAIKTYNFMEKLSASPDQDAYYSLLSALCKYGNVEEAEEFMLKFKLFPLETEGFNIILHAWCTNSIDIFEAKRVWREMASNCITPDAMSYTHMISCVSRVGNLFDSLRLYDEMKKRGWVPGLEVYNSLIYAMTRENCLSDALKIIDKIKDLGLQPNSRSYNCLICPLCEAGKFEEARGLLLTMTKEGIKPTLETYKAFLTTGDLESTLEILRTMKNDKVGPDSCTFILIFDVFFRLRQPENVLKVWVEMRDFGVHPESTHYSSLIYGLVKCGCLVKAKEMHTEMISNGFVDDPKLKKQLEGADQESHQGRIGLTLVRRVDRSESPSVSHIKPHRGRRKRGGNTLRKNKRSSKVMNQGD